MSGMEAGADAGTEAGTETVTCPKCGHVQENTPECGKCGVIFSKYYADAFSRAEEEREGVTFQTSEGWSVPTGQLLLLFFLLAVLGAAVYHFHIMGEIKHRPGVLAPADPEQRVIRDGKPWTKGERTIVPMASYRLKARVLSTERYRSDNGADISPIDLALGWGIMSDQRVVDQLEIFQGNRRYVVMPPEKPPAPIGALMRCSANVHILPANDGVRDDVLKLRVGEIVELSGYLVGVQEKGQWTWVTSLRRDDTGDGACEVFWVKKVARPHVD